jgi:glycine/D-amino acid oxidase-like deaminating enzyme
MSATRRQFCSAALVGLTHKAGREIEGGFALESADWGHRLRDRARFETPRRRVRLPVVIVGGGIAGLSAAWRLNRRGFRDFLVLEMELAAGGNSRWGENEVSRYPWAAHYVPVPGKRATLARELFTELGLLRDGVWDERHLCHSPQERLFLHGRWQEGLEPVIAASRADREQYARFEERIAELRAGGRFTLPMEDGAAGIDPRLDRLSMDAWMDAAGLTSPYLRWLVDYACRDDYGVRSAGAAAWAGIHYFASREGEEKGPLTWPEGNGWITARLLERLGRFVRTGEGVWRIRRAGRRWEVFTETAVYEVEALLYCAPGYLAGFLFEDPLPRWPLDYSPWLVANLTLDRQPRETGAEPAWDNVIYDSPGLGYVIATHQNLGRRRERTVWTYYHAFAEGRPADYRRVLLGGDWGLWRDRILADLARAHPDIGECVSRIDVFRIGHAMPRPAPGTLRAAERLRRARGGAGLYWGNSDLSALPLFEEAQYRGVRAAEGALARLGRA